MSENNSKDYAVEIGFAASVAAINLLLFALSAGAIWLLSAWLTGAGSLISGAGGFPI